MHTTPDTLAARLRGLADAVQSLDLGEVRAYLSFGPDLHGPEPDRVAGVDALAAALGLHAEPVQNSIGWNHEVSVTEPGVTIRVHTRIEAPPQRCACGEICSHRTAVAA